MSATIRTPPGQNITVKPHVQACANAIASATGADNFGTYLGHEPSAELATDIFTPTNSRTLGDKITDFAIKHIDYYGIDYIIYRQQIYNPEILVGWRDMADRGSPTANHMDHVHLSFMPTGNTGPVVPPPVIPPPVMKGSEMVVWLYNRKEGDYLYDGPARMFARITWPGFFDALTAAKIVRVEVDDNTFTVFRNLANNAKFSG